MPDSVTLQKLPSQIEPFDPMPAGRRVWRSADAYLNRPLNEQRVASFQATSRFFGLLVAALGLAVLAGWALDIAALKSVLPGLVTMKANTAVCFVLAGTSLLAAGRERQASMARRGVQLVAAAALLLLGVLTLAQYVFAVDLGIDQLLFTAPAEIGSDAPPGRMALATTVGFVLTALALLLLDANRWQVVCHGAALGSGMIGLLALLGYIYDVDTLRNVFAYSSVALHTALAFVLINAGALLARPRAGWMTVIVGDSTGGFMARRLLPLALIAPLVIGWLRIEGEHQGLISSEFGVALVAMTYMVLFGTFILRTAHALRQYDEIRLEAEAKQREKQLLLNEKEALLSLFIEHAPSAIAMFDRDMRYLAVSDHWLDDFELGDQDVIGRSHYELFPDLPEARKSVHRRGLAGESIRVDEDRFERANGRVQWLRSQLIPWRRGGGEIGGIVIFAEDITANKLAVENLRRSELDLHRAQSVGAIGSWRLDVRRNELTWSQENHRIFGVPSGTALSYEFFLSRVHPGDRDDVDRAWQAALGGAPYDIEHRLLVNGEVEWVRERAELEFDAAGKLLGAFGTTQQITDRKALEARLIEARDEARRLTLVKSAFLANMSHEIRTPLNVIIGLGHLLRRDIVNTKVRRKLEQLCASSDHLLALINDILDLSKIEAEQLALDRSEFLLKAVVEKVMRMVAERAQEKGVTLTVHVAPDLRDMRLIGDPLRLSQVLINLCGNAVKFTDHGTVRLTLSCPRAQTDQVKLRFAVKDTGCGIAPADQGLIFQPFSQVDSSMTRTRGGTGLGLSISQRLVAMMGSTIQVDSQVGVGSTFSFEVVLPRAAPAPTPTPAPTPAPADFHGRHILFADDHPQSQEILLEMIEDLGCFADVAANGAEAVECAQARNYDLILMDMQMPKMDGLAATRAIRALPAYRNTPIVALTANAYAEDRQRCLDAGMNDHQSKPVTPATLAEILGRWLPAAPAQSIETPLCDNELSRALLQIAGLQIPPAWLRSAEHLVAYRAQLERFLASHGQDMTRLHAQLAAGEFEGARGVAHDLKGIAGLLGAWQIAALASEIEQGLRSNAAPSIIAQLADESDAQRVSLAKALEALPGG